MDLHRGGISECIEIRFRIIPIFTEFDSYPLYMFGIICMFFHFMVWKRRRDGIRVRVRVQYTIIISSVLVLNFISDDDDELINWIRIFVYTGGKKYKKRKNELFVLIQCPFQWCGRFGRTVVVVEPNTVVAILC